MNTTVSEVINFPVSAPEQDVTEVADLLEKVADAWESGQFGWCQRGSWLMNSDQEAVAGCAWGGLMWGAGVMHLTNLVRSAALQTDLYRARHQMNPETPLVLWNDLVAKDKQDVIDLFKNTAKDLRNQA